MCVCEFVRVSVRSYKNKKSIQSVFSRTSIWSGLLCQRRTLATVSYVSLERRTTLLLYPSGGGGIRTDALADHVAQFLNVSLCLSHFYHLLLGAHWDQQFVLFCLFTIVVLPDKKGTVRSRNMFPQPGRTGKLNPFEDSSTELTLISNIARGP